MVDELEAVDSFEYRGWLVRYALTGVDGALSAHADLSCNAEHLCRIALSSSKGRADVLAALEFKAQRFIDRWLDGPPKRVPNSRSAPHHAPGLSPGD